MHVVFIYIYTFIKIHTSTCKINSTFVLILNRLKIVNANIYVTCYLINNFVIFVLRKHVIRDGKSRKKTRQYNKLYSFTFLLYIFRYRNDCSNIN